MPPAAGPLLGPAPLVTQPDDETGRKHSLLILLCVLFRRHQNKEKGTGSYDQERDQPFWLKKEVSSAQMSLSHLAMSPTTERRGMVVSVEGGVRLPHFSAIHNP